MCRPSSDDGEGPVGGALSSITSGSGQHQGMVTVTYKEYEAHCTMPAGPWQAAKACSHFVVH